MSDRPVVLDPEVVAERVSALAGWTVAGDRVTRTFEFADFPRALAFMTAAGVHAEKLNHHPEWSNVYNRVSVELTTHDAGGITELDLQLAAIMNDLS